MLNIVCLQGRLVAAPELRQTNSGKQVALMRIACDRGRRDANGNNMADFFNVVAWEQRAEFAYKYFEKGQLIAVDGRLQSRNYQDKNGSNRTAIEIVASNINFCGPKQTARLDEGGYAAGAAAPPAPARSQSPAAPGYSNGPGGDDFTIVEDEGDFPF